MKQKAIEFLLKKKLLKEGNTEFIITMEDGAKHDLVELLTEFTGSKDYPGDYDGKSLRDLTQ